MLQYHHVVLTGGSEEGPTWGSHLTFSAVTRVIGAKD